MVFALESSPHTALLTEKQYEKFCIIIQREISDLLESPFYAEDEELKALHDKYSTDEESWDETTEMEQDDMKNLTSQFFNQMFGIDFEADDFDDPAKIKEKIEARQAAFEAEEQARTERRSQRKKTDRQLAAEAKRKTAEEAIAKTAKQMYMDLIRHFHPDKEPDEQKRLEKTEIMKQITAAYDADDHLKLLELQMTLLADRNNVFADFNENQLKYFNDVLKRQVQELEMELDMCSPEMNGNLYGMLYHPVPYMMQHQIEQHICGQKEQVKMVQNTLKLIQTSKGLKQFVKGYEFEDDEDIPDELPEMMGVFGR
jgi:hypothetical protein